MNAELCARWYERQGHRVVRTRSTYWYEAAPYVFQAFPFHWVIDPSDSELDEMFRNHRALVVRFSTQLEASMGRLSYHVKARGTYDLSALHKKARYDIRKGLSHVNIQRVSLERMASEGWRLRLETLRRQGREHAEKQHWWRSLCLSADGIEGIECWGALHGGQMVASILGITIDNCCSLLFQQSLTEHLCNGVNNALAFAVTKECLSRGHISEVFYGLHSLDAPPSVDEFKFRIGFRAYGVRQRVAFHPMVAPLVNSLSRKALHRICGTFPSNNKLAKLDGLMSFYLDGRIPLDLQQLPVSEDQWEHIRDKGPRQ